MLVSENLFVHQFICDSEETIHDLGCDDDSVRACKTEGIVGDRYEFLVQIECV